MSNNLVGLRLNEEAATKLNYLSIKYGKSKSEIASAAIIAIDVILDFHIFKDILNKNIKEELKTWTK